MASRALRRPAALAAASALLGVVLAGCALVSSSRETVLPPAPAPVASTSVPTTAPSTAAPVPSPSVVVGDEMDCGGAAVSLSGADQDFTLVGECPEVTAGGTELDIDMTRATVGTLLLNGDRNDVDAATVGAIVVGGQDNEIDAAAVAQLTLNGERNEVEADGRIDAVTVSGNDNRVTAGSLGTIADQGQRNTLTAR